MSLLQKIDTEIGENIFKNSSGIRNNIYSRLAIAKARHESQNQNSYTNPFQAPTPGVLKTNQKLDQSALEEFKERYTELIETDKAREEKCEGKLLSRKLNSNELDISKLNNIKGLFPEQLKRIVKDYYGSNFRILGIEAYRHYPHSSAWKNGTENFKSIFKWHLDPYPPTSLKIFVPLSNFTEENGATKYLSREDTKKIESSYRIGRLGKPGSTLEEKYTVNTLESEPGQPTLINPQSVLHRAGNVSEGKTRDLLTFLIIPFNEPLPANWTKTELFGKGAESFASGKKQLQML